MLLIAQRETYMMCFLIFHILHLKERKIQNLVLVSLYAVMNALFL